MENQNIEWKETWRDEYLKWICGFANALGGTIEIGRNNKGEIIGLPNSAKLLEELPNKIRTTMGIVAEVNLRKEEDREYIVINVNAHPNAISHRGRYYYRSGSTNQELTGYALEELILRKYGRTWDSAPVPRVSMSDFYHDAFDIFRKKAIMSKRLSPNDVAGSDAELLQALKLTEGDYILRAALLLFHQDPGQWCFGSYIKIGYFENDADLLYQDEIGGALIGIADRVMDIIYTKYFKGLIRYEGIQRIDEYPMSQDILREAVLNAVVHRDYSTGNPIHIKIYEDKVVIYNDCQLPGDITEETILRGGRSNPHNPIIAGAFFRSGQIEAWGRGIEKMKNGCVASGLPVPDFDITSTTFTIRFHIRNSDRPQSEPINSGQSVGVSIGVSVGVNETRREILRLMSKTPNITAQQIADIIRMTKRRVEANIRVLKNAGLIERVGADKNGFWVVK
ncbi:MAG: putative DNA binding domain-containing protein [Desulfovibrio sp.]|nr:putative DNA binding domain-containing protein [Desulfovibrio sp.]